MASAGNLPLTAPARNEPGRILIVDDDPDFAEALQESLMAAAYAVETAGNIRRALEIQKNFEPEVALIDLRLGAANGADLIVMLKQQRASLVCVMMTAYAEIDSAIEALRSGADDYLRKPLAQAELFTTLERGFAKLRLIHEKQAAESALRENREMLEAVLDAALVGINAKDVNSRYLFMNSYQAQAYNLRPQEVEGRLPGELVDRDYGAYIQSLDRQVVDSGEPLPLFEEEIEDAEGVLRSWLTNKVPLKDEAGRVYSVVSVSLDVTERKAMERQLRQAQKMEAVGHLTGGVAHDFNNLLGVILGSLDLLAHNVADDDHQLSLIKRAIHAAERGADLTHRLLAFSRRQPLKPEVTDLNRHIVTMGDLLGRALGETIEIDTVLAADAWPANLDQGGLETALINLAVNARDAMPDGGRLTIETANVRLDRDHGDVVPGHYAVVTVSDTGCGIAPRVIDQVFEPFFTTKEIGQGSGLGLSLVYGFMKQSGGHASIYSELDLGTTVKLYFPRASAAAETPLEAAVERSVPGAAGELILVVEDDPDLRTLAVNMVTSLGYRVVAAEDGKSALAVLAQTPGIDLLFTDVVLPRGMNGVTLAQQATARQPGLKVLYASGYTANAAKWNDLAGADANLLSKPYRKAVLARRLRDLLDGIGKTGATP